MKKKKKKSNSNLILLHVDVNPLTPMSDQDRIFPDNININQISNENKEKYQYGDN